MIVYLHIPKTAGSTLLSVVKRQYAPGELVVSYGGELAFWPLRKDFITAIRQNSHVRAVCGHFGFGVHLLLGCRDARYVTLVRDPAKRIVSFYLHQAREPKARLYETIRKGAQLRQLIEDHLAPEFNNYVVRVLATDINLIESHLGPDWPERVAAERWEQMRNTVGTLNGLGHSPIGPYDQIMNETHLRRALRNIEDQFCFVGITEQMDESVRRLALGFGWPKVEVTAKLNAAMHPHPALDDKTVETIHKYNRLEYALYKRISAGYFENFAACNV